MQCPPCSRGHYVGGPSGLVPLGCVQLRLSNLSASPTWRGFSRPGAAVGNRGSPVDLCVKGFSGEVDDTCARGLGQASFNPLGYERPTDN